MNSNLSITVYLLLLISLGYVASDVYLPSLPSLALYFQASENEVQMTLFSYLVSFSLAPLVFGPVSDHVGRKKVILGGILIGFTATLICLFAQNIQWLIASRFLQGLGLGAVLIASRASVSDLFTGKVFATQMSLITMLMPLILAIAPTLGGVLQENFGWQAVFVFLLCYMVFIAICAAVKSESLKTPSHSGISQIFSNYRLHLKNRLFIAYGVNFVLPALGLFGYLTISPFLFQERIGLSAMEYGTLSLYVGGTIMASGYLNIKLIHHFSIATSLSLGGSLMLISGGLLLFFHIIGVLNTWSLLLPSLIFFSCLPLCVSNAASKSMGLVKSHFGSAAALLTTFQFLVGALGTFIFTLIADNTALPLALCFIVVGCLSLLNLHYAFRLEQTLKNC